MTLWCAPLLALGTATADVFAHASYRRRPYWFGVYRVTENELLVGTVLACLMAGVVAWLLRNERFAESWEDEGDEDSSGPASVVEEGAL